jgi:hypothetical protein
LRLSSGVTNSKEERGINMRRITLVAIVALLLAAFTLTGCGNNDSIHSDSEIVGTWLYYPALSEDSALIFNSDGTFEATGSSIILITEEFEIGSHVGTWAIEEVENGIFRLTEWCQTCAEIPSLQERLSYQNDNLVDITLRRSDFLHEDGWNTTNLSYHKYENRFVDNSIQADGEIIFINTVHDDPEGENEWDRLQATTTISEFEQAVSQALEEGKDEGRMMVILPGGSSPTSIPFLITPVNFEIPEVDDSAELEQGTMISYVRIDGDGLRGFITLEAAKANSDDAAHIRFEARRKQ